MGRTRRQGIHIQIEGLQKRFDHVEVLKNIHLEIQAREFIAIVGKSGCGKSTLLRQIAGLDSPSDGVIYHDQTKLRGHNKDSKIMFQDSRLLPWLKVRDNVGLGLSGDWQEKADWALEQVGLLERANEWPSVLSGGQKQRVALARALVSEPRLLLLDEPLGALDALTRIEMQSLIENLWKEQGFTAIMVTHDVGEAVALADRVILIEAGVITFNKKISLHRPRERGNPIYAELEGEILNRVLGKERENENHFVI